MKGLAILVFWALLFLVGAPVASAQIRSEPAQYLGAWRWPEPTSGPGVFQVDWAVGISKRLYAPQYDEGSVLVFDVSNIFDLRLLGEIAIGPDARGVYFSTNTMFVVKPGGRLQIFSIANLAAPTLIGEGAAPGDAALNGAALKGSYLYTGAGADGIAVFDISKLDAPKFVRFVDTPGYGTWPRLDGPNRETLLVADRHGGLAILDVSQGDAPVLRTTISTAHWPAGFALYGRFLGIATGVGGVEIYDLLEATPRKAGVYSAPGLYAQDVRFFQGRMYVAAATDGLHVVELNNGGTDPKFVTKYPSSYVTVGLEVEEGYVGAHAYVADLASIQALNIMGAKPTQMGRYVFPGTPLDAPQDFYVREGIAYNFARLSGVQTFDVSQPLNAGFLDYASVPNQVSGGAIAGDYAYVVSEGHITAVSIGDPRNLVASRSMMVSNARDIAISGRFAFVAVNDGVTVYEIVTPPYLTHVTHLPLGTAYPRIEVFGTNVFLIGDSLRRVDVSNPRAPQDLGVVQGISAVNDVIVRGDYLFVAADTNGVAVVDLRNPTELRWQNESGARAFSLALVDEYLFVANQPPFCPNCQFVDILDVELSLEPRMWGTSHHGHPNWIAASEGDLAYMVNTNGNFTVMRRNPTMFEIEGAPTGMVQQYNAGQVVRFAWSTIGEQNSDWRLEIVGACPELNVQAKFVQDAPNRWHAEWVVPPEAMACNTGTPKTIFLRDISTGASIDLLNSYGFAILPGTRLSVSEGRLTWTATDFILQSAPTVIGPWSSVPGSPRGSYEPPVGSATDFYRLVRP